MGSRREHLSKIGKNRLMPIPSAVYGIGQYFGLAKPWFPDYCLAKEDTAGTNLSKQFGIFGN